MQILTGRIPIYAWIDGVPVESLAFDQLRNIASVPVVGPRVVAMPDVHPGVGATVGSVVPTRGAVIPAAVGVDIGCGMAAAQTNLVAADLPDNLRALRLAIEEAVPHGGPGVKGSWAEKGRSKPAWVRIPKALTDEAGDILAGTDDERMARSFGRLEEQFGTLGTGNHFVEVCLDRSDRVWTVVHSGSRGVGNAIGTSYINVARAVAEEKGRSLPDKDLAWLDAGTRPFTEYIRAMLWAQGYAYYNRSMMRDSSLQALSGLIAKPVTLIKTINCHHNFTAIEEHGGEQLWITRKGAIKAGLGDMGVIPGSMGAKSYIVRGKGNPMSFETCSHGAGRRMSRGEAKRTFTVEDHIKATEGVECRKDAGVVDETPGAYKDIDAVMAAQEDLVEVVEVLRQVVCVKG